MSDLYHVVIVDDEEPVLKLLRRALPPGDFVVDTVSDPHAALQRLLSQPADVALLDLVMPGLSGMDLLRTLKQRGRQTEVILMSGYGGVPDAVMAIRGGACDFLTKPFTSLPRVAEVVRRAAERHRLAHPQGESSLVFCPGGKRLDRDDRDGLIGRSPPMRDLSRLVDTIGKSHTNVLLQGESGTGKELVARAIHARSSRKQQPFVAVNCLTLNEDLMEAELFGSVRGAFTGAIQTKKGLFQAASGGTLFLDEIGDIPPAIQTKLLRAVQEGEIRPVGQTAMVQVDLRIIAATQLVLRMATEHGFFREDLYYRLAVISLIMPPLRERMEDVPLLARHFLRRFSRQSKREIAAIDAEALRLLCAHHWPGNVRELENVMERAHVLGQPPAITAAELPRELWAPGTMKPQEKELDLNFHEARELALRAIERDYIADLLRRTRGNLSQSARVAGLDRSNFKRIVHRCQLAPEDFRPKGYL